MCSSDLHTAELVAHLAEVEVRRLYLPAGHLTMRDFCIEELHIDEEEVDELLRAARASRTGG